MSLSPLDFAVVGVFLAFIYALGFSAKLRESTAFQFIAAGRVLSLPLFVATLVATWYGGILGVAESVAWFGIGTIVLLGVPYYVFALLYAYVYARRVRSADEISLPERLHNRYGTGVGLVSAVLIFLLGLPSFHVLMLGTLLAVLSGWPLWVCVPVATVVGTAFLYKGGLLADARMSLLAFSAMYVGFAVIAIYCLVNYPPAATLGPLAEQGYFNWDGGAGIATVIGFFLLGAWTLVDPGFHQRVSSAVDPDTGRRGVFYSVLFWMLFDLMTVTTGLYAIALAPELADQGLRIFPVFGDMILPSGLKAVFLCGMTGTIISAMVGYALVSGGTFGRDIVARLKPELDALLWTRIGIGVACLAAIAVALTVRSVVDIWYLVGGAVIGPLLLPIAASYGIVRDRWSSGSILASILIGAGVSFGFFAYGMISDNRYVTVSTGLGEFSFGTLLPGLTASALVLAVAATFKR